MPPPVPTTSHTPASDPTGGPRVLAGTSSVPSDYPVAGAWLLLALGAVFALSSGDRVVLPVLKTTLAGELQFTNRGYSALVTLFMATYTFAYLWVGRVIHQLGVRWTLTAAMVLMSAATSLCGAAHGVPQLGFALVLLGLAQASVVPAVTVAIVTTIATHRHAFAYALVNAIQSSATILFPTFVAAVTLNVGWRWSFFVPALAGLAVAGLWWRVSGLAGPALARPERAAPGERLSWRTLLESRPVLVLIASRAISDPFWFFFQYWHVAFLRERIGLSLASIGRLAWIPPLAGVLAVFVFGMMSDRLVARGWSTARARLIPMLCATTAAIGVFGLPLTHSVPVAITLCALASMMCGTWLSLSTIFMGALVPRPLLGSALGLMSAVGGVSALILNGLAGPAIDWLGYALPLWFGACLHPLAAALLAWQFRGRRALPQSAGQPSTALEL